MTGAGTLPPDWSSHAISAAADKIIDFRGRTPKKLGMSWGGGDIRAISARNVRMGHIDFTEEFYVASDALYRRWMTQGDMERGDALITTEAPLGNVAAVPDDRRYVLSQRVVLIRPRPDLLDKTYFVKILQSPGFQDLLHQNASGSTALGIQRRRLEQLPIPVPPLAEQRQIGQSLQDADDLITALDRLIAKKQAIKQGMIHQLLTGKTRLPGFTAPWHDAKLGSIANVNPESLSSGTDPKTLLDYISLEDVERGELLGHTRVRFGSAPSRARRVIKRKDVLFGTVRPNLQSHAIFPGGLRNPIASTGFAVVRSSAGQSDPRFIFYLLMSHLTTAQVDRIIAGSNYPAVSSADVRGLTFALPRLDEQQAIGSVLGDCDDELSGLKRRLSKARDVKQGMMQELLTGRTRLPIEDDAA